MRHSSSDRPPRCGSTPARVTWAPPPQLAVKMPAMLAPTFVGSLFTFDVTFTAIIN